MNMDLRNGVYSVCAALMMAAAGDNLAQSGYPNRPVRLVVPSEAGGGTDLVARTIATRLAERLGQQVLVVNRPGAGTMIGGEVVAKSPPDGYTLLMGISTLSINPATYKKVPYDALRDFAPITQVVSLPSILVVHPSLPVKTVKDLIVLARTRPGELNFASAGAGANAHVSMELFLSMAKLKMVHIPFHGTNVVMNSILGGHVEVTMATVLLTLPHTRSGRLRALGVTSAKRTAAAPQVPTIAEAALPGYEAVQWYGVLAPVQTPRDIIVRLHGEITRILQLPEVKEQFTAGGADPVGTTPEEFARFIRTETDKWTKVVRNAGFKPL